jgi:threonine 3-dehydrogenase
MTNEMRALVKAAPKPASKCRPAPCPKSARRRPDPRQEDRHLRHRHPYLAMGRLGARTVPVPLVTGHEFAGEIVEIGRNVEGLSLGQRCSGEGHLIGKTSRQSARASSTSTPKRGGSA